jgi:multicomponent Na+:H+ antiporter subunit B
MNSLILSTVSRLLVALMFLFSVFLLLRGHNEPGGGFLGGLVAGAGLVLLNMTEGPGALRAGLWADPCRIALVGLGMAIFAGLVAAFAGLPFLTGLWTFVGVEPAAKGVALGTPLLFDVGVYVVVVGAIGALVLVLEEAA